MDVTLIIIGIFFLIIGILGCIVPFLPGPSLAYCSLILLQFTHSHPFSLTFLIVWGIIVFIATLLDYYIPIWGTKRFKGTKGGTWGATTGLILGVFFPPAGIIIGLLLGAFVGEILNRQGTHIAFRSAIGAFVGFLAGTFMKLVICGAITFYFIRTLVR